MNITAEPKFSLSLTGSDINEIVYELSEYVSGEDKPAETIVYFLEILKKAQEYTIKNGVFIN